MDNLKQIRYVTENYPDLQGLKQVPLGVCMVLVGMLTLLSDNNVIEGWGVVIAMIVLSGIGIATQNIIVQRYEAHYGKVESSKSSIPDMAWIALAAIFTLVEIIAQPPFAPVLLVIAAYFVYRWRESDGILPHYIGLAVLAVVFAGVPFFVDGDRIAILLICAGILLGIGGILDHRLLAETLQPPAEEHD